MRFFADENIPGSILQWLRDQGYDVESASEIQQGALDEHWLSLAETQQRLILTSDKDFGELIYRERLTSFGVILLRMSNLPVSQWVTRIQEAWAIVEANPLRRFIVISPKRVRVRTIP